MRQFSMITSDSNGLTKKTSDLITLVPDKKGYEGIENEVVNLYPEMTYQEIEGFGCAITDASGYVYSLMNDKQKEELLDTYFSKDKMDCNVVRIHLDSCDFSTSMYEAMSNENDRELKSFSFERTEKYIIPMLKDAERISGKKLELMLSPWSPPKFMKTNNERRYGGELKQGYEAFWADYLCRYIKEFKERGFIVKRISIQNEAKAKQTWDSCIYSASQEKIFLRDYLYPAMHKNGLDDVEIFIWDHNKERLFDRTLKIVDDSTKDMVTGVAFHWYSGEHFEAIALTHDRFPNLKLIVSESCIEYRSHNGKDLWGNAVKLSHEMIGDLNNGITAFYDWNLLLDETGGPNHAGNLAHAPFMYDRNKKELNIQTIGINFGHFSSYIKRGAKRIGFSRYTNKVELTAFLNPNGKIVTTMLNPTNEDLPVELRLDEQIAKILLPHQSISTLIEE